MIRKSHHKHTSQSIQTRGAFDTEAIATCACALEMVDGGGSNRMNKLG